MKCVESLPKVNWSVKPYEVKMNVTGVPIQAMSLLPLLWALNVSCNECVGRLEKRTFGDFVPPRRVERVIWSPAGHILSVRVSSIVPVKIGGSVGSLPI